jgi:hypothetical protein
LRTASAASVTGLTLAKACSQPGILATGAKMLLAKTTGNAQVKPATSAVCVVFEMRPMKAAIQLKA